MIFSTAHPAAGISAIYAVHRDMISAILDMVFVLAPFKPRVSKCSEKLYL